MAKQTGGRMRDAHHLLFSAREWTLRPEAKLLRQTPSLIPSLDRDTHEALHRACPPVPLLGYHALKRTVRDFEPVRDTLQSVDNLLFAMEAGGQHPHAHPIERELAELAVRAVDLQRPYIRDGMVTAQVIDLAAAA